MRRLILVFLAVAAGVGGTLAVQHLTLSGLSRKDVERRVAEVATERDGLDILSADCSPKPYPEGAYRCFLDPQRPLQQYYGYLYSVEVQGDKVEVGPCETNIGDDDCQ